MSDAGAGFVVAFLLRWGEGGAREEALWQGKRAFADRYETKGFVRWLICKVLIL